MSLLCAAQSSQLAVIDVQTRLATAMPPAAREQVLRNAGILLQAATLLDIPITLTEQYPQGLGATDESLRARLPAGQAAICKTCFSSAGADDFNARIDSHAGRHQLILAGMETHVCVLQTAMDMLGRGYQVFIAEDAVSSRSEANRQNALARLRTAGAVLSNTESIVFEWLRDAKHPQFKAISALIK